MTALYEQWKDLIEHQTEETFKEFWEEYSGAETKIYSDILDHPTEKMSGTLGELAAKYEVRPVIFMGFLDGINESIKTPNDFQNYDEDSQVEVEIEPEKLFYNMLKADADYLYTLEEWLNVYDEDKLRTIVKDYRRSKIVHVEKKPGRNDPCPCGSGKKYKNCCGKNA